jgi:uncharacterized protein
MRCSSGAQMTQLVHEEKDYMTMPVGQTIIVVKRDHDGREVLRWPGVILEEGTTYLVLEARFERDDIDLGYTIFRRGDRFVEHYFTDRWYNVFEIHDGDDDHLKGWYCNFTRPATLNDGLLSADDLALDLWVYPDGRQLVLDEDEFEALPLSPAERQSVLDALKQLQRLLPAGNLH